MSDNKQRSALAKSLKEWLAKLTPEQKAVLQAGLNSIDTSRDGAVSFDELAKAEVHYVARVQRNEQIPKELDNTKNKFEMCLKDRDEEEKIFNRAEKEAAEKAGVTVSEYRQLRTRDKARYDTISSEHSRRINLLEEDRRKKCEHDAGRTKLQLEQKQVQEVTHAGSYLYTMFYSALTGNKLEERPMFLPPLSPSIVSDVVGLAQQKAMDYMVKEAGISLSLPMAGRLIESNIAPTIQELNTVLKENGLPIIADSFAKDAADAARKRPLKKLDADAGKKPSR